LSVFKKKGSPYYHYDFQFRGQRHHGSTACTGKRHAEEFERRERQKAALPDLQRPPITLDEACGLYQDKVEAGPSWPTIRYMLAELIKGLGSKRLLSDISQRSLQLYFSTRGKGRSDATVNREIENARAVWRHAKDSRYDIGEMPKWKSLRREVPKRTPRELSFDEEAELLPALRDDVRDAIDFLLKSGWRRAEVLNLRWSDCNFATRTAITRIKGGEVVSRPLTDALVTIIKRQPKVCPQVFTYVCQKSRDKRRKGERYPLTPTALRGPFKDAKDKAGVESFRIHDLRHTRGTRIVRQTGSLAAAKEALKHRSLNTTLRYAHVLDDDTRRALDASDSRNSPEVSENDQQETAENRASGAA
jgi:integrase